MKIWLILVIVATLLGSVPARAASTSSGGFLIPGVDFSKLVKTDITMGKFIATMTDDEVKFKVKALEEILPSGCNVCTDFTAVEADVSVGSVGSAAGFSTVAVRNANAEKVIEFIKEKGYADFGEADPEQLGFLVGHKKKRAANIGN